MCVSGVWMWMALNLCITLVLRIPSFCVFPLYFPNSDATFAYAYASSTDLYVYEKNLIIKKFQSNESES